MLVAFLQCKSEKKFYADFYLNFIFGLECIIVLIWKVHKPDYYTVYYRVLQKSATTFKFSLSDFNIQYMLKLPLIVRIELAVFQ